MTKEDIKQKALINGVPIIQDASLLKIQSLIKENNIKKILEIGTAVGYSAISFATASNELIEVASIERSLPMYQEALENVEAMNLKEQIHLIFGDALDVDLSHFSQEFDLLFIDAAKAQNIKFFERYSPFVKDDGLIIVDNILFHGVDPNDPTISKNLRHLVLKIQKFLNWLDENKEYETTYFKEGDGLAISRKKIC